MKKMANTANLEGRVFSVDLKAGKYGPNAKNPGMDYIRGRVNLAIDEDGTKTVPVDFNFVSPVFNNGKRNETYFILQELMENPEKAWQSGGKDTAEKISIRGQLGLNDYVGADGNMVAVKRFEGSFITKTTSLKDESKRATFSADMFINSFTIVEADEEKGQKDDFARLGGYIFGFGGKLLPFDFILKDKNGIAFFDGNDISGEEPMLTTVMGEYEFETYEVVKEVEYAFGAAESSVSTRNKRNWLITRANMPYDLDDEEILTKEEISKGVQDRELYLATVKKRREEWLTQNNNPIKENPVTGFASAPAKANEPVAATPHKGWTF